MNLKRVNSKILKVLGATFMLSSFIMIGLASIVGYPALIPGILAIIGIQLYFVARRLTISRLSHSEIPNGEFILYLRGFQDDKEYRNSISNRWNFIRTLIVPASLSLTAHEEQIQMAFYNTPLVAIGSPKDKLLPLGAKRLYRSNDEWKETVLDMIKKSKLVILKCINTENFLWELQMCLILKSWREIVLLLPSKQKEYSTFKNTLEQLISTTIPSFKPNIFSKYFSGILFFDVENDAHIIRTYNGNFNRYMIAINLRLFLNGQYNQVVKTQPVRLTLKSKRLFAFVIDLMIPWIILFFSLVAFPEFPDAGLILFVLIILFNCLFESLSLFNYSSIGKQIFRLKVIDKSGFEAKFQILLIRSIIKYPLMPITVLGIIVLKIPIHDLIFSTIVIDKLNPPILVSDQTDQIENRWESELVRLLRKFKLESNYPYLYCEEDIPASKLNNAINSCNIPEDISVMALVDFTVFGSAKNCLVFTPDKMYYSFDQTKEIFHYAFLNEINYEGYNWVDRRVIINGKKLMMNYKPDEFAKLFRTIQEKYMSQM